jgi:hypothetical protein
LALPPFHGGKLDNNNNNNNDKHAYAGTNYTSEVPTGTPTTAALWPNLAGVADGRSCPSLNGYWLCRLSMVED